MAIERLKELFLFRLDAENRRDEKAVNRFVEEELQVKEIIQPMFFEAWPPSAGNFPYHYDLLHQELQDLAAEHEAICDEMEGHRDDDDPELFYKTFWQKRHGQNNDRAEQVRLEIRILSDRAAFDL